MVVYGPLIVWPPRSPDSFQGKRSIFHGCTGMQGGLRLIDFEARRVVNHADSRMSSGSSRPMSAPVNHRPGASSAPIRPPQSFLPVQRAHLNNRTARAPDRARPASVPYHSSRPHSRGRRTACYDFRLFAVFRPAQMSASTLLPTTASTLRTLYAHTGNQCAKPDCSTVLINANGSFVAAVCRFKAAENGGPRFDEAVTPGQCRDVSNLNLRCRTCHALVEAEPARYTVATLTKWKRDREARFKAIGQTLHQYYLAAAADMIDAAGPQSLRDYIAFLDDENLDHDIHDADTLRDTLRELADYVDRLRHLTFEDRQLLADAVAKALALDQNSPFVSGLTVHPDDLKTIRIANKNLSLYRVERLADTLARHNLGSLDPDEPSFRSSDPAERIPWIEIANFLEHRPTGLPHLLLDLDFSFLD